MPTVAENLQTVYYQNSSISINVGATIEYNMNTMLNNITAVTASTDSEYINGVGTTSPIQINPFKKLFPADSVIKPFRPLSSGIKYYIVSSIDTPKDSFSAFRTEEYPSTQPRVYYPGLSTSYKYWVTPKNSNADITVNYVQSASTVIEAYSAGTTQDENKKVVYKTSSNHGFIAGNRVTITNLSTGAFNLSNKVIASTPTEKTFTISDAATGTAVTGASGTATLLNSLGTATPTKSAYANKIIVQFEKNHSLPTQYRITVTPVSGAAITTTYTAPPSSGRVERYWNGTNWNATSISEPYSFSTPQAIKSIRLEATNPGGGKYIGVIEISARWVKDISSDIVSMTVTKESSDSSQDILPIGRVTANSIQISAVKYNQDALQIVPYNRDENWPASPTNLIHLTKNAEIKPYFIIYHTDGSLGTSPNKYDKEYQGVYFVDSWSIDSYGNLNLVALDGAKPLMETIAPDILCDFYPVTAVIRRLLDSVGFTSYQFNLKEDDKSIPVISYWWTDGNKTVWEYIQEICRDIQMNAFMDDNGTLQFYSRDYMYDTSRSSSWNFRDSASGLNLPNIISMSQKEVPSANQVRVLWSTPTNSSYVGQSAALWQSSETYLAAGGLKNEILATTPAENTSLVLDLSTVDQYSQIQSVFNFNGYFLINSEIIEFDAIEYRYLPKDGVVGVDEEDVWIESSTDLNQYRYLARSESKYFQPTGKYRVKKRGALGTTPASHEPTVSSIDNTWKTGIVIWE